ncbi:MAG: hypothetical protein LZ166_02765 [Thaumarchaeota archaeon]|jgi:hypothetical protein|nr:hypothetical protein [Candidatus Wolframiiraptor allenii]
MMLSERIAYFYQAASISFAISLMLNLQPVIVLSLYLMIFTTIYVLFASRELKNISENLFTSSVIVNPNPSKTGDDVRIRAAVTSIKKNLPAIIVLDLEGLEIVKGDRAWSGLLGDGEASLDLVVKSGDPGIKFAGPLKIAVMDPLGVVVKELKIHPRIPVFIMEAERLPSHPSAYSSLSYPVIGLSKNQFIGADHEYRISQLQEAEAPAKIIDWRKTAQRDDGRVYVKLYDRLMKGDIAFGIGSGLEIILPNGSRVYSEIIQGILAVALFHLEEGARIWLIRWVEGGKTSALLVERSRAIDAPEIPSIKSLIHITRLIDERELAFLKRLSSQGITVKLILIDLGADLLKISREEWVKRAADLEMGRLLEKVKSLDISYAVASLEDFGECLRRILAYRRTI